MTTTLELFSILGSPYAWRVQLALVHKALPYEDRVLSMSRGELRTPEFLAMSPRGKVPVLRAGELVLTESLAILAYLDRRFPERPLFGRTPEEAGIVWRHVAEYTSYVDEACEAFILPMYFGLEGRDPERVRHAIETLARELQRYERVLGASPYLAGDAPSAADFVVLPHVQSMLRAAGKPAAQAFRIPFAPIAETHPAIAAWLGRVASMPGYERTYPAHWR